MHKTISIGAEDFILGCLPPDGTMRAMASPSSEYFEKLPRTKWRECDMSSLVPIVYHQGRFASCASHCAAMTLMLARAVAGKHAVPLSPTFAYGMLNFGIDRGTTVTACMIVMCETGDVTLRDMGADTIRIADGKMGHLLEVASNYRLVNRIGLEDFDAMCSTLTLGHPIAFGIGVGKTLNKVDKNGVIPAPSSTTGGHGFAACGLRKFNGSWQVKVRSSWGARWGVNGEAWMGEEHFIHLFDAVAAVDSVLEPIPANAAPPVVEIEETPTQPIVIPVEPVIEQEPAAVDVPIATSEVLTAETSPLVAAAQRDPIPEPEPIPVHKGPPARVEPLPSKSEPPKPPAPPQKKGGDFSQNFSKRKKKDDK